VVRGVDQLQVADPRRQRWLLLLGQIGFGFGVGVAADAVRDGQPHRLAA
jgi:hypothetical protein